MKTTILLAAWALAPSAVAQRKTGEEVILKAEPKTRGIEFYVKSGGCTKKANFGVETLALKPLTVRLVRLRPDYCEANLAAGQKIEFTYAELGAPAVLSEEGTRAVLVVNQTVAP